MRNRRYSRTSNRKERNRRVTSVFDRNIVIKDAKAANRLLRMLIKNRPTYIFSPNYEESLKAIERGRDLSKRYSSLLSDED